MMMARFIAMLDILEFTQLVEDRGIKKVQYHLTFVSKNNFLS